MTHLVIEYFNLVLLLFFPHLINYTSEACGVIRNTTDDVTIKRGFGDSTGAKHKQNLLQLCVSPTGQQHGSHRNFVQ